jgi:hypothetical protein
MPPQLKAILKLAGVALLVLAAVLWAIPRAASLSRTGDQSARVWFYDQSEKRLYAASPDIPPPDKGVGGKRNDGVRAVVVGFEGAQSDSHNRRIAYLQTYTPELKTLLERIHAARAARRPFEGHIPSRDSDYFQTNTLVSRADETTWHPISSPEGQRIMAEWRTWRGPDGQEPRVVTP